MSGAWNTPQDQTLFVNGVDLADLATIAGDLSQLLNVTSVRGNDMPIPGMHGELWTPYKPFKPTTFTIPFLVKGAAADGTIPSGSTPQKEFYARVDALAGMFRPGAVVYLLHPIPDGTQRICAAVVTDAINFARGFANRPIVGRFNVAFKIPTTFWIDPTQKTATGSPLTGGTISMAQWAGSNAPVTDLIFTIGAGNNPSIVQGATYFTYGAVIPSGGILTVDCGNFTLSASGTAFTPDYSAVSVYPGPYWFSYDPNVGSALTLNHTTGAGSHVNLTASGYRKFFNG